MARIPIPFTKMHGLGNDFMVIDAREKNLPWQSLPIRSLANRHTGIGFDQLLVIEESAKSSDVFCRIFNSDGSEAEQCGNGLRCIARYLHEEKLIQRNDLNIATLAGEFPMRIHDYDHIEMQIEQASSDPTQLKITLDKNQSLLAHVLRLGNPHAIIKLDDQTTSLSAEDIKNILSHEQFADGVNLGLMQVLSKSHIRLKTIERGAGETNACGSNACASVLVGISCGWLAHEVQVEFKLGSLQVTYAADNGPLTVTGPASRVYDGTISLPTGMTLCYA